MDARGQGRACSPSLGRQWASWLHLAPSHPGTQSSATGSDPAGSTQLHPSPAEALGNSRLHRLPWEAPLNHSLIQEQSLGIFPWFPRIILTPVSPWVLLRLQLQLLCNSIPPSAQSGHPHFLKHGVLKTTALQNLLHVNRHLRVCFQGNQFKTEDHLNSGYR